MKKNNIFTKLFISLSILLATLSIQAQQVNTMYFMENVPVRNYLNPAFQPLTNFYFGLPVLGFTQISAGNNSITLKDLIPHYEDKINGKSVLFLNEIYASRNYKTKFYDGLKNTTLIGTDVQLNLLDFGWRHKTAYWSFGLTQKIDASVGLPKDLFKFALYGTPNTDSLGNKFNFKTLSVNVNAYTEMAVGYSKIVNENWTIGGKLKFLYGEANLNESFKNYDMNIGVNGLSLNSNASAHYAGPVGIDSTGNVTMPTNVMDYATPAGLGAGIDLGVSCTAIPNLSLSASVTDLGFINWTKNARGISTAPNFNKSSLIEINGVAGLNKLDSLANALGNEAGNLYTITHDQNSYTTLTKAKLNVGAEYGFFENKLGVGLLSRSMLLNSVFYEELTASVNARPANWFNMSLSYSVLNGRASNIGAALGVRTWFLNWFLAADYIPVNYIKAGAIPVPYNTDRFNLALGVNMVFGNKQDKDKDGVIDRKDKCPDTPQGVSVDVWGCPLDADTDGVPDFLDKCPSTPIGALVDTVGCPVDSDGDGVVDYLDHCPETPVEAYGQIDTVGCPLDTDADGVPNYLDKCPDTPVKAIGFVDSVGCSKDSDRDGVYDYLDKCPGTPDSVKVDAVGCPLDTDGDGVADYLDKCPGTPLAVRGRVDSVGCPLDTDADGVADFLDMCPNTPVEARNSVDKNGCNADKDGDGVPDFLDKCPGTPEAARGMVDSVGCPLDSDGDGVADYKDNCPKVKGVPSNFGCPEIKKEVKTLFQKALQGIQFESGKDLIKPASFPILDQIAKVLIDNPTYLIEVRGHTDNVGKKESNQMLSEKRAFAVRNYLIGKGVAETRMTSNGFGDTKPVAPNTTPAGKAKNRRVEFVVTFEEVKYE